MTEYTRWQDIRAEYAARAGGEEAVAEGKRELLAECMGVTQKRVSQVDQVGIAGQDS
ncbi:hypothetical protein SRB5_40290 [Streptomyces sp. RB5]|uniref:Uncharacterized protein n=1 Tax=Streptomyces smaragdinus TaxID=2585196 RepID=A0A7K0CKU9_9ACTN|nr:hypothetical protein [Streptomyces smaragdinus]MQY13873.1 hypothetical protein [Streptomyces smaragdinus]